MFCGFLRLARVDRIPGDIRSLKVLDPALVIRLSMFPRRKETPVVILPVWGAVFVSADPFPTIFLGSTKVTIPEALYREILISKFKRGVSQLKGFRGRYIFIH
jgi:hypothetical protein